MGRYFYPNAIAPLDAKKQFLRDHGYKIGHCFQNTWGSGYVLFDTVEDVNAWYKEHTGHYFYSAEYEPGTIFTESDAYKEIESHYGTTIDDVLNSRDNNLPILAIGLPSSTAFGNNLFLSFAKSVKEEDIGYRFYLHYEARIMNTPPSLSNSIIRSKLTKLLYTYFYNDRFKKRIEGTKAEQQKKNEEYLKEKNAKEERERKERLYQIEYKKYLDDKKKYDTEIVVYNEAMRLKRNFIHGGHVIGCSGEILIWVIFMLFIPIDLCLIALLTSKMPLFVSTISATVSLGLGYYIINHKLKTYFQEEHFDEEEFKRWQNSHPNSPYTKYIKGNWPLHKPLPPTR